MRKANRYNLIFSKKTYIAGNTKLSNTYFLTWVESDFSILGVNLILVD